MEGQVNGSTQRFTSSRCSDSAWRVARNGGWRGQNRKKGGFPSHPDQVKETVFLGVIMDENLNWKSEISHCRQ